MDTNKHEFHLSLTLTRGVVSHGPKARSKFAWKDAAVAAVYDRRTVSN